MVIQRGFKICKHIGSLAQAGMEKWRVTWDCGHGDAMFLRGRGERE